VSRMHGSSDRIPDGIEPLVGYRAWAYQIEGTSASLYPPVSGTLANVPAPNPWAGAESGWVVASCWRTSFDHEELDGVPIDRSHLDGHGEVPEELCECGFYSMKTLPSLLETAGIARCMIQARDEQLGCILGRIQLAGKIVEHDLGYRAERARIAQLIPFEDDLENGLRLARMLGVPLGDPVACDGPDMPTPDPTQPSPPDGSSSVRRRVCDWVRDVAA
jgi:hypothetical protein